MLFLSAESWIVSIIRLIFVIWGCIWGPFLIYQGKKSHVKLLIYWGIFTIGVYLTQLGTTVDFITILITGRNMDGFLYILLVWPNVSINVFFIVFALTELLASKFKWYFLSTYIIMFIFYQLCLFLNTKGNVDLEFPIIPGEEIINDTVIGPIGNALMRGLNELVFLGGFGLIYKGIQSQGIIRKKYIYVAMAVFFLYIPAILDAVLNIPIPILAIVNIIQLGSTWFSYLGLRKEPEKRKKKVKEEVKITDSFFRIIQRPDQITEEEVTYYREQKICLICKGKVAGFNIFLCPNCEALYHEDCARTLSDLENACWVCNQPIDETKPTKPFKIVEEKKIGELLAKEEGDLKIDKKISQGKE